MEAKTVINLTIDSYNNNDPKHGLRGVPGLAPNLITNTRNSDMNTVRQYFRIDYTDYEWYQLMIRNNQNLPTNYEDCFDEYGVYKDKYWDIFCVDIFQTNHN